MAKIAKAASPLLMPEKPKTIAVRRAAFIVLLRQTGNVSSAARCANLAVSALYRHRANHAGFKAEWDAAVAEAVDAVEEAVMARVRDGVEKSVYYGGKEIGTVRNYSDALAMFILKSKRPEVYARMTPNMDQASEPVDAMTEAEAESEFDRRIARLKSV
jgi:hypothetical protein